MLIDDKKLFDKIIIIMQNRHLDLATVFQYPLGPLPWSLSVPLGNLKKTNKASLFHKLEGSTLTVISIELKRKGIIDEWKLFVNPKFQG